MTKNSSPYSPPIPATRRRRRFGLCCLDGIIGRGTSFPRKKSAGKTLNLGLASYTFRAFNLDKTLAQAKRAGLKNICLKSMHLPLNSKPEELAAVAAKVADAGLTLYGAGVIEMSNKAQVTHAFDYGKAAGLRVLVISPDPAMLPWIEQHVKKYDISAAIHNHGPGDRRFPTPQSVYEKSSRSIPASACASISATRCGRASTSSMLSTSITTASWTCTSRTLPRPRPKANALNLAAA